MVGLAPAPPCTPRSYGRERRARPARLAGEGGMRDKKGRTSTRKGHHKGKHHPKSRGAAPAEESLGLQQRASRERGADTWRATAAANSIIVPMEEEACLAGRQGNPGCRGPTGEQQQPPRMRRRS